MIELKTWEDGELIGLLRSEIEYIEDFTDTGRLDDVVEEIEKRLLQSSNEFYGLHQEKSATERNSEHLEKRSNIIFEKQSWQIF